MGASEHEEKRILNALMEKDNVPDLIVVENDVDLVTVNGVKYKRVAQKKINPKMFSILMGAETLSFGGRGMVGISQSERKEMTDELPVKEFELIQKKESNLSANARKQVVHTFNINYTKVD